MAGVRWKTMEREQSSETFGGERRTEWTILLGITAAIVLVHMATNGRYGFHRDEL